MQEKTTAGRIFLLPNEIFTLGLRAGEIAVYAYLLFCEDRETHLCYPSFRKIGECTGMSPNTVRKYITQLEDKRPHRNPADYRVDIGRDREKRDAALHDFAYIRSRQLPPGAPVSGTTAKEAHQEKTVRTKLGPVWPCVRFWRPGRGPAPARNKVGLVEPA